MTICLVAPPQGDPFMPPLGIAALAAFLKEHMVECRLYDFGIEYLNYSLNAAKLLQEAGEVQKRFDKLRKQPTLDTNQLGLLNDYNIALLRSGQTIEKGPDAKTKFRSDQIRSPIVQRQGRRMVSQALKLASLRWVDSPPRTKKWHHVAWDSDEKDPEFLLRLYHGDRATPFDDFFEHHMDSLLSVVPDAVGISVSFPSQMAAAFSLAGLIHRSAPNVKLTLGGSWITQIREPLSRSSEVLRCFDAVVFFEGERPLLKLIQAWSSGSNAENIAGTIIGDEGREYYQEETPIETPANTLPTPTYDGLPLEKYFTPSPVLPLATSRGCYWNRCTFCNICIAQGRKFRGRSIEKVMTDLTKMKARYGSRHFYFTDDALPPRIASNLADGLANVGLEIRWISEARLDDTIAKVDMVALRRSGASLLLFGLESGSQPVLDLMRKGIQLPTALRIIRRASEAGIPVQVFVMVGFPGETFDDWFRTIEFLEKASPWISSVATGAFGVTRDSAVARNPDKFGVRILSREKTRLTDELSFEPRNGFNEQEASILVQKLRFSPLLSRMEFDTPFTERQLALFSELDEGWRINTQSYALGFHGGSE